MKFKYLLIGILLCGCLSVELLGQELSRWVIGSGGGFYQNDRITLSSTAGQAGLAGTMIHQSMSFTAGFQQMDALLSTGTFANNPEIKVTAYPNPFKDQMILKAESTWSGQLRWTMVDTYGRIVLEQNNSVTLESHSVLINTAHLPVGWYDLIGVIQHQDGNLYRYHVPLVKLQD